MFDLVKMERPINETELNNVLNRIKFDCTYNQDGTPKEYKTFKNNPLKIAINVKNGAWYIHIITSIHKYFAANCSDLQRWVNYAPFSYTDSLKAFDQLAKNIGIDIYQCIVTYYEIGLSLATSRPPTDYIKQMEHTKGKILIDDSFNYGFEKVTKRSKFVRYFYKIYDKTHEIKERQKINIPNFLRIELVLKRISPKKQLSTIIEPCNFAKDIERFKDGFLDVSFVRGITGKGLRANQIENIKNILAVGVVEYGNNIKAQYKNGIITESQYKTKMHFVKDWKKGSYKNINVFVTDIEKEYKTLIINGLKKSVDFVCPPDDG